MLPELQFEEYGVEDLRITEIEGKYWITYVALSRYYGASDTFVGAVEFSRKEVAGGATLTDLRHGPEAKLRVSNAVEFRRR